MSVFLFLYQIESSLIKATNNQSKYSELFQVLGTNLLNWSQVLVFTINWLQWLYVHRNYSCFPSKQKKKKKQEKKN